MIIHAIREYLKDPRVKGVDIDSVDILNAHRRILSEKPLMMNVFKNFYYQLMNNRDVHLTSDTKSELEIGAGVSFFKKYNNSLIVSDIKPAKNIDKVINAQEMDIPNNSLKAIYGINCFHHFPNPRLFFKELERVLDQGGGCLLIEPYYGPFARKLYSNVHKDEHFNRKQRYWNSTESMGYMTGANQALSYIIFKRDKKIFENEFPNLEIVYTHRINNYFEYLCSGGVNFRQLVPNSLIPFVKFLQKVLTPVNHLFALHYIIVIRKK